MRFLTLLARAWRRDASHLSWWAIVILMGCATGALVTGSSVYDVTVRQPLPVPTAARVVSLGGLPFGGMVDPVAWWSQAPALEAISMYSSSDAELRCDETASSWIRLTEVAGDFFRVLGNPIALGRSFTPKDHPTGDVAVVTGGLWRQLSAGRRTNREMACRVGGIPVTVVGVARDGFGFPSATQMWIPQARADSDRPVRVRGTDGLPPIGTDIQWIGLLRQGRTLPELRAQLLTLLNRANRTISPYTGVRYGEVVGVAHLTDLLSERVRPVLRVVLLALLAVFCLSFANTVLFASVPPHEDWTAR